MRYILGGLLLVIGFVAGFALSRFISSDMFELNTKINPVEVLTLCVMVFITIYIPAILTNKLSNKRHVKNALIRRVEKVQERFSSINMLVTDCCQKNTISNKNKNCILQSFTFLSNDINTLNKLLEKCDKRSFLEDTAKLVKDRRDYKGIVTGSDFQDKKYDANTKKEEEQKHTELQGFLSELIFKINSW